MAKGQWAQTAQAHNLLDLTHQILIQLGRLIKHLIPIFLFNPHSFPVLNHFLQHGAKENSVGS